MITPQGNIPQKFIWQFAGNPSDTSISIINPPKGAIVIDYVNAEIYFKTSDYGDNSGYIGLLGLIDGAIQAGDGAQTLAQEALDGLTGKMNTVGDNASLPTSDPAAIGELWSDANTVKTSAGA